VSTDDLIAALRAALDAEEATARAAGAAEWSLQEHEGDTVLVYDSRGEPVVYDEGWPTPAQGTHIVAHNPAFVLADIAAKRAILDLHAPVPGWDGESSNGTVCVLCAEDARDGDRTGDPYPCATLRLLAEAYGITA
jgi:hypothetical protein